MWNSPHSPTKSGKRYSVADLSALILPIDELLYLSHTEPIADLVEERILQRLDRGEFVHALYEVFEALTGDAPFPEGGHIGIHEAIIAELLRRSFDLVVCEIQMGEESESAREGVWQSVDRLLIHRNPYEPALPWILEDAGMILEDPESYRISNLTMEHWRELLCGEGFLFGEFLWDEDWRMDFLMDLPPDTAKCVTDLAGLDLEVVQALPHSPDKAELRKAEDYLRGLIDQLEHEYQEQSRGRPEPGPESWPDVPF